MFTRALIPLDGTEVSGGIIPFATQLARGMGMGVVLGTAVDLPPVRREFLDRISSSGMTRTRMQDSSGVSPVAADQSPSVTARQSHSLQTSQLMERIERDVRAELGELAERMELEGIATETAVRFGPAAESVMDMARDAGCDLIAMSTRGRSALGGGLLGSVTYKVMHESPVPVLAITPERAGEHWGDDYSINRVIAPLDGSEFSEAALPYAAALSRKMGMGVTLARALNLDSMYYKEGAALVWSLPDIEIEMRAEARRYLEGVARPLRDEGLDVQVETPRGRAASEIAELARRTDHSMIAIATHGRSGVRRLVLGSVAEAVVRESGDPVLVVRPGG